jgi:hypothetical protein
VCEDVVIMREQLRTIQEWKIIAESDLRRLRDLAAKIDLLVALTSGGGIISLITLAALVYKLVQP